MSDLRPNCTVCVSPMVKQINEWLIEGMWPVTIRKAIKLRQRRHPEYPMFTNDTLGKHRRDCLGIIRDPRMTLQQKQEREPQYIPPEDVVVPVESPAAPPAAPPPAFDTDMPVPSPEELSALMRQRLMHQLKYEPLSSKQLYDLVVLDMKTRIAEAEAAGKVKPSGSGDRSGGDDFEAELGEAMGNASVGGTPLRRVK